MHTFSTARHILEVYATAGVDSTRQRWWFKRVAVEGVEIYGYQSIKVSKSRIKQHDVYGIV